MGCKHSKVENEEAVRRCRDRRNFVKQLLRRRVDLAAAHIAYLQALRNTGATLRQFIEVESTLLQHSPVALSAPPSPPPPPPPPPPRPPAYSVTSSIPPYSVTSSMPPSPRPPQSVLFSPIRIRKKEKTDDDLHGDDSSDDDTDSCYTPLPPPPPPGLDWEELDPITLRLDPTTLRPFNFPSPLAGAHDKEEASQVTMDDDMWTEVNTESDVEDSESVSGNVGGIVTSVELHRAKSRLLGDDNSSMVGLVTKDSNSSVVASRSKKSLVGIVKEIDEYFLKAAASGSDVAILLDSAAGRSDPSELEAKKGAGKNLKTAKVFSWSWSFKSMQANRESSNLQSSEDCGYGYHGKTLDKLYDEEQKLYKLVKDEEFARLEYKKYSSLLQRLESGEHDKLHAERVRDNIEVLETRIISLEEAVSSACLTISMIRDEQLYPQVIELSAGLVHMWRNMYECHQVQSHIAQQVRLLGNRPGSEPTTDSHCSATSQLEIEVSAWHNSFCNLITLQREYVSTLNQWIRLTDCLPDNDGLMRSSSGIRSLCGELQRTLEGLPVKDAAEAIKFFLSVVHSIVIQQAEERQLKRKSDNVESKFQSQLEKHGENATQNSGQPLNTKDDSKLEVFRKRVEEEKARYLNSMRTSRAMTLNKLQTSLPKVFDGLAGFSGVCVQAFEGISRCSEVVTGHSGAVSPADSL